LLGVQSLAGRLVEQMHERRIWLQPDLVTRIELMTSVPARSHFWRCAITIHHLPAERARIDSDQLRAI